MDCVICKANDWLNVDQYRPKQKDKEGNATGTSICKSCGFISYPNLYKTEEEIKAYYRKEYRRPPTIQNLHSGQRKLHYHNRFLREYIDQWKTKEKFSVCEIGAAYGMFLNFLKREIPNAEISGTELTLSYRRNAYHEYGINLTEDFDTTKKYDFIASYKVAEHQMNVDKRFEEYFNCLNEDGYFYISVPIWFWVLENFGLNSFRAGLEYYYDTNHINVWTKQHFEFLLKKSGFKVIKENHTYYNSTYLCQKDASLKATDQYKANYLDIIAKMEKIKAASDHYFQNEFEKAAEAWPNFPMAYMGFYEMNRKKIDEEIKMNEDNDLSGLEQNFIFKAMANCPESADIFAMAGSIMQKYNKWEKAALYYQKALDMRPEEPNYLMQLAHCFRFGSNHELDDKKRAQALLQAREITKYLKNTSLVSMNEATNWIYDDNSRLPTPYELGAPRA